MGKIITTHLTVNASAHDVWATLTDLVSYRLWNPYLTSAAGVLIVGERLTLTVHPPGGRSAQCLPWVTAVEENRYLEWLGRLAMPGILDGRHSFNLTPMGPARTLVQQSKTFTGALLPFSGPMLSRTHAGLVEMNHALATRTSATSGRLPHGV